MKKLRYGRKAETRNNPATEFPKKPETRKNPATRKNPKTEEKKLRYGKKS